MSISAALVFWSDEGVGLLIEFQFCFASKLIVAVTIDMAFSLISEIL